MKKKSFVLSWGRKIFFGLGWGLTSLMALNYFQSMIIPQNFAGWAYFLTTFIGHYGLIISLLYFLLYCPVVSLLPSYYVSRVWSITLLLSVNAFIFIDSYLFSKYRFHVNSFLGKLLFDKQAASYFQVTPVKLTAIGVVTLIIFLTLWMRGERIWRYMQSRFSNPVRNWYLVVILICLVVSHAMHMLADAHGARYITRLSNLFPVHFPLTGKKILQEQGMVSSRVEKNQGYKDFYYPASELKCQIKNPKNVLLIVMDEWPADALTHELTPNIQHYISHGTLFINHYSGGDDINQGYFSLLYALPPVYKESALNESKEPVFISQLKKAKMDLSFFKSGTTASPLIEYLPQEKELPLEEIENQLIQRDELAEMNPFLMHVYLQGGSILEKDRQVMTIVDLFIKYKLIQNTIVAITATHGGVQNKFKTPLVLIWPEDESHADSKVTSHYDLLPTIMAENWKCKNPMSDYSFGRSLYSDKKTEQLMAGDYSRLSIINPEKKTITRIDGSQGLSISDLEGKDVNQTVDYSSLLKELENLTQFFKRR